MTPHRRLEHRIRIAAVDRIACTAAATCVALTLIFASAPPFASAQSVESGQASPRTVLDRDFEIALARSAAPSEVSTDATVLVWAGDGFETAREGSNGVTCYVARSWPESLEPHCFDVEGSSTILPIHLRQMELWHRGRSNAEIDQEIADGIRTGELRLPSRPAMSYMMSEGQRLINEEGTPVGSWRPHVMIYYPYLTADALGLGPVPSTEAAVVVDPGTPLSNIMVVVSDFVPAPSKPPAGDTVR